MTLSNVAKEPQMTESFDATVLLRSEQTAGAVSAVALTIPPGWAGPPLHHHAFDEAFYVLDGEVTFQLGDELATARPNTLVFAPGDSIHTLANLSAERSRYLLLCTPAGFERRFANVAGGRVPETIVVGSTIADGDHPTARRLPPVPPGINVLVRGEQSLGRIAVMDNSVGADFAGPPLHHHDFDELFYVVEGELTFQAGSEVVTRRAGEVAFAPRGEHHTWANHSDAPARTLIVCTPAGFEPYFGRMAAERAGEQPPDWALREVPPTTVVGPQIPRAPR
jgi:quercetin dioxygenase-like cupin family protein